MINTNKLKAHIVEQGLQIGDVAEKMGISRVTLHKKLSNKSVFRPEEIKHICEILAIDDAEEIRDIFLS